MAPVAETLLLPSAEPALNLWRVHGRARLPLQKRPQVLGLLESMSHPSFDGDEILDGLPYFVALEVAEDIVEGLDNGYFVQRCVEEPVESRSLACPIVTKSVIAADRGKSRKDSLKADTIGSPARNRDSSARIEAISP